MCYLFMYLLILLCCSCYIHIAVASNQKTLCFSGSSLYQRITVDCNSQNPSYNGTWYCATIEVCETDISSSRQCIMTRGCATFEQCFDSSSGVYNGDTLLVNNQIPAGMTIKPYCCQASFFPTDDTVSIDYTSICNPAYSNKMSLYLLGIIISTVITYLILYDR